MNVDDGGGHSGSLPAVCGNCAPISERFRETKGNGSIGSRVQIVGGTPLVLVGNGMGLLYLVD